MNLPATSGEESVKTPISENSSCAVAFPDAFAAKAKPNEADGESKTMIRSRTERILASGNSPKPNSSTMTCSNLTRLPERAGILDYSPGRKRFRRRFRKGQDITHGKDILPFPARCPLMRAELCVDEALFRAASTSSSRQAKATTIWGTFARRRVDGYHWSLRSRQPLLQPG